MGAAVNGVYADVKLRTARVKISQALLRLNAIKPGNEASDLIDQSVVQQHTLDEKLNHMSATCEG